MLTVATRQATENVLAEAFFAAVERSPAAPFLVGETSWSYGTVSDRVRAIRDQLLQEASSHPVVLLGPSDASWVLHFLGAQAAGLLTVPATEGRSTLEASALEILGGAYVLDTSTGTGVLHRRRTGPPSLPEGAALCLPTSGSTGAQKYALRSAASLLLEGERYRTLLGLTPEDSILAPLPLQHAFNLGLALGGAVAAGCSLEPLRRFSPRTTVRRLVEGQASVVALVPSAARLLCEVMAEGERSRALRHVIVGAGPLDRTLEQDLTAVLGVPPARNYGSTETGATLGTAGQAVPADTTGFPLPGVEAVVAPAIDAPGSLFVRTDHPFLGYLTSEGVDARPVSPDGWFSTGDLAVRRPDGSFAIEGRLDGSVRRGGRKVQPREVEDALRLRLEVRDCVVTGAIDDRGEETLRAHVEPRPGSQLDATILHEHLEQHLAPHKIPTDWKFYDRLPRTPAGKPDRLGFESRPEGRPLLSLLASHRLSAILIAAYRTGLLSALARSPSSAAALATELDLEPPVVDAVLRTLAAAGVLRKRADYRWEPLDAEEVLGHGEIAQFEAALGSGPLAPEAVVALLRGKGNLTGAWTDRDFAKLYLRVMGREARRSAWLASRKIELPPGAVLEVGRPAGAFRDVLAARDPGRTCRVVDLGPQDHWGPVEPPAGLGTAYLYNVFRYFPERGATLSLAGISESLAPGGALVVADVFVDPHANEPWLEHAVALEWLRFGAASMQTAEGLCAELRDLGFHRLERIRSGPCFELVVARRQDVT